LQDIAGKTRTMPDEFIAGSGADVTEAFRDYLAPLLGKDLPEAHRLGRDPIAKILAGR
jgi:6-phosphofructokinase 1